MLDIQFWKFFLCFLQSLSQIIELIKFMVLMFQASDVIDKFISGQFFQNLRSFSCIQFNSFKFFLLFL